MTTPGYPFLQDIDMQVAGPPVTVGTTTTGNVVLATGIGLIIAASLQNNGTVACKAYIADAQALTSGQRIILLAAPVGACDHFTPPLPGILFRSGIALNVQGGVYNAAVTYIPLLQQP